MTAITNNNREIPSCSICLKDLLPCENITPCRNKLISHIFHRHCAESYAATIQKGQAVKCPTCRKYKLVGIASSNVNDTNVTIVRRERPGATFPGEGSFVVIDLPRGEPTNRPDRNSPPFRRLAHQRSTNDMLANLLRSSAEERPERNENGVIARVHTFGLRMVRAILKILIGIARRALGG